MRATIAVLLLAVVYVLHQDFWWWHEARPLVFGAIPIGLFYHAAYTAALPVVFWILIRLVWPVPAGVGDAEPPEESVRRNAGRQ